MEVGALLQGRLVPCEWAFGGFLPDAWPAIAWPYYVLVGTIFNFGVAVCFKGRGVANGAEAVGGGGAER